MFFRNIVAGLLLLYLSGFSYAKCTAPSLPNNITIAEHLFSLTTTFSVGEDYGTIRKKHISLTPSYDWFDSDGKKVATAKRALISWGAKVEVFDCEGKKIGTIQEKVSKSLFRVRIEYSILDKDGRELAKSVKIDLDATSLTISSDGRTVAKLKRPWINSWISINKVLPSS